MYLVYVWQNKLNFKMYVGYSIDPAKRWADEEFFSSWEKYSGYEQPFYRAIRRDGVDNFTRQVIEEWETNEEAREAEKFWIEYFRTNRNKYGPDYGYNLTDGGDGVSGLKHTDEWKDAHSNFMKEDWKRRKEEGWISPLKGVPLTEEHKQAISIGSIGKNGTNTGKTYDNDWCINISKGNIGRDDLERRRFANDIEKEICNLYQYEKYSFGKISKLYNCSKSLIINIIDRNNIEHRATNNKTHNNIFTFEQELEMCNKYNTGLFTIRKLSIEYNCGRTTMRQILVRHKIIKP